MDILLAMPDKLELPTEDVQIKRLSKITGEPVVFRLQALPYSTVDEIRKSNEGQNLRLVLRGVVSPSFRDAQLMEKYDAPSPLEVITKLLLPGEIDDLALKVERLSGYRTNNFEAIKKK